MGSDPYQALSGTYDYAMCRLIAGEGTGDVVRRAGQCRAQCRGQCRGSLDGRTGAVAEQRDTGCGVTHQGDTTPGPGVHTNSCDAVEVDVISCAISGQQFGRPPADVAIGLPQQLTSCFAVAMIHPHRAA